MMQTKLLSIPEFAKATGLKYDLARDLVLRGDIPSVQVGPRRRIDSRWVEEWLRPTGRTEQLSRAAAAALDDAGERLPEMAGMYKRVAAFLRAEVLS